MKVFLAGATGAVGRPLCRQLLEAGHEVVGTTRSPGKAKSLEALGVGPAIVDALDAEGVLAAVAEAAPEVVISQLTDLPTDMNDAEDKLSDNDRARVEGTRNLLAAARDSGVRQVIAQSLAFAYHPDGGDGPADEEDPLFLDAPEPFRSSAIKLDRMEREVIGTDELTGTVLRYGFFYGPGTWFAPDGSAVAELRRRRLPRVGSGGGMWSMCHVEDAASACVAAVERGAGGVFNVCDDRAVPTAELIPAMARAAGAPRPMRVPTFLARWIAGTYVVYLMTAVRGASNARAKRALGWEPSRPDPIEGLERALSAPAPD